ncbi:MAG: heme exporter protein CcmD [Hyphomicrobiales bacterium]|nr:MAG: heme exporter protein CcmD [Hyphomicrobiales bacterium]
MQHFGFILASYLSSAFILAALAFWLVVDHRVQKKALADLDARGIRRRSAGASSLPNDNSQKSN